jgi:hypothetical protein
VIPENVGVPNAFPNTTQEGTLFNVTMMNKVYIKDKY